LQTKSTRNNKTKTTNKLFRHHPKDLPSTAQQQHRNKTQNKQQTNCLGLTRRIFRPQHNNSTETKHSTNNIVDVVVVMVVVAVV
jgi:hypothetical protein